MILLLIVCGFLGFYALLLFTGIAIHLFCEWERRAIMRRRAGRMGYVNVGPESRERLP